MSNPTRALKARYVFPVDAPPIEDGVVKLRGSTIVSVGRSTSADSVEDLGNVALLPGLVNAHTHLEFSDLTAPLGEPDMSLPDWIRAVIEYRTLGVRNISAATQLGIQESVTAGTSAIGEISSSAVPTTAYTGSPIPLTAFHEMIGLSAERGAVALQEAHERIAMAAKSVRWASSPSTEDIPVLDGLEAHRTDQPHALLTHGLSPHAPYSIHSDVVAACGVNQSMLVAMHLAESREELELLSSGTGPFVELLQDLGAWDASAIARGTRPLDYLKLLAACDRSLVIHGNYLDDEEIAFLAANRSRMTVVYCPRTHAYFGHPPYPLAKMLAAGVRISLGTDSRASNPDLSVLEEMRYVAKMHPDVSPEEILAMATTHGAEALGTVGSLASGTQTPLISVPLPENQSSDPYELLFQLDSPVAIPPTFTGQTS